MVTICTEEELYRPFWAFLFNFIVGTMMLPVSKGVLSITWNTISSFSVPSFQLGLSVLR